MLSKALSERIIRMRAPIPHRARFDPGNELADALASVARLGGSVSDVKAPRAKAANRPAK